MKGSEGKGIMGALKTGYNQARQTANYINQQRNRVFGAPGRGMSRSRSSSGRSSSSSYSAPPSAFPSSRGPGAQGAQEPKALKALKALKEGAQGGPGGKCNSDKGLDPKNYCKFTTEEDGDVCDSKVDGVITSRDCKVYTGPQDQCGVRHTCLPINNLPYTPQETKDKNRDTVSEEDTQAILDLMIKLLAKYDNIEDSFYTFLGTSKSAADKNSKIFRKKRIGPNDKGENTDIQAHYESTIDNYKSLKTSQLPADYVAGLIKIGEYDDITKENYIKKHNERRKKQMKEEFSSYIKVIQEMMKIPCD